MMKSLPKQIYVTIDNDGRESWLLATGDRDSLARVGDERRVGVYVLQKTVTLRGVVEEAPVKPAAPRRRGRRS